MELRAVLPDDWVVWRDTRLCALADAPEAFGSALPDWESADEARWRERLLDVPFNIVAVTYSDVVGQASGTRLDGDRRTELVSMWVAPGARGTGVADALVAAVADYAAGVGAVAIRLSVRRGNDRAIAFYQRVGFATTDEPGDEPDEIAMVRQLA